MAVRKLTELQKVILKTIYLCPCNMPFWCNNAFDFLHTIQHLPNYANHEGVCSSPYSHKRHQEENILLRLFEKYPFLLISLYKELEHVEAT